MFSPSRCAVGGRRGLPPTSRSMPLTRAAFHGQTAREQWLAAGEATRVAMLVSFLCGQFRSVKEYNFRPTRPQLYPGMLCDFDTATFRAPQNELDTLRQLLQAVLHAACVSFCTLQRLASKRMSMTVAIRPVSLWTHAMFAVIADVEKSGLCIVDLTRDSRADILGRIQAVAEYVSCLARGAVAACATLRGSLDARVVGCDIRRMG